MVGSSPEPRCPGVEVSLGGDGGESESGMGKFADQISAFACSI